MYDVGYTSIVNVDISEVAIKQMTALHTSTRPLMSFDVMDICDVSTAI